MCNQVNIHAHSDVSIYDLPGSNFGHIHTHTEYSTLDGMGKVEEIIRTAKELGQDFVAITDHGSTSALYEAQVYGDKYGVKVIHGCEFYYEREIDGKNGHLLVLAKNNVGLTNLFKMQELAYLNFYRKPRINWDILSTHHEGLIVTSACLGSPFNQYILQGDVLGAKEWAEKMIKVFGDDFYIEIQPNQIPEQYLCNETSIRIAEQLGINIVATNDVHYTLESDCFPHEVLLAMQLKNKMSNENRFKFSTNDFWLKSEEEMYETFEGLDKEVVQKAIHTTREIADKCHSRIEKGKFLPTYHDIPEGKTERELLVEKTIQGVKSRKYQHLVKDVQHEIDVIDRNGYSGYFLVVQDYVNSAKERGEIVGDGRGSGAGSKVAYCTGITEIAPHEFDLLFERFMADGRSPDFDVDFSDQNAVFEDLQQKYGIENVAHIVTFGRMTPKAVVRKVLNTFEHSMTDIKRVTSMIDEGCKSMKDAYDANPALLDMRIKYKVEFEVIDRLEGVISHEGKHAGGVIVYKGINEIAPIKIEKNERDERVNRIVGWDKYMLEELGHYKFDILGLETLPVVRRTLESIHEQTGKKIDLSQIDKDDPQVYDMLCEGDVSGVFQIAGQAQKVMQQRPRNFRDLIAINALIRPGVGDWNEYLERRNGKAWEVYEARKAYMDETQGTMTYQEQYLLDGHILAGWDIAYADKALRKNKDIRNDVELKRKFIDDCVSRGHNADVVEEVWKEIEDAVDGGYGFNKSHSASYAMLSYQTAWLKRYYPIHFYASLMSGEKTDGDGQDAIAGYIAECKQKGITILPPDINLSDEHFVPTGGGIAYRITTIKHVGESAIKHIKELRPIASFQDFMERRDTRHAKKNVIVNLIKAGAFDFCNKDRAHLMWEFDMSQRTKTQIKNNVQCDKYEVDDLTYMEWEKEVLGMYLSQHPMEKYGFKSLEEYPDQGQCIVGGEVFDVFTLIDKKGNPMAFVQINTLFGNIKLLCFSFAWKDKALQETLQVGNIVLVRGKRSGKDVMVNSAEVLK